MATDGVKIIDSDTAYDTYWDIMDLYDQGATVETIRQKVPFPQPYYFDDYDYEIYTTAYALAFWEIGFITDEIIQEVKKVIEKGASVKSWIEEYGEEAGKARQKELDKLWKKINKPNLKVRKRKKYREVKNFIFNINDVLTFQHPDNNYYYATIILDITQYRGKCRYKFGKILFKDNKPPTIQDIKKSKILGKKTLFDNNLDTNREINKLLNMEFEEIVKQGGIDAILKNIAQKTHSYTVGMSVIIIEHKNLKKISKKFQKIGSLKLNNIAKNSDIIRFAETFENLIQDFDEFNNNSKTYFEEPFDIEELIDKNSYC